MFSSIETHVLLVLCTSQFSASGILISGFSQGFDSSSGFSFLFLDFVLKQWTKCKILRIRSSESLVGYIEFLCVSFLLSWLFGLMVSLFCYLSLQEMLLLCFSSWLQCTYHLRTPFGSYKFANFWSFLTLFSKRVLFFLILGHVFTIFSTFF